MPNPPCCAPIRLVALLFVPAVVGIRAHFRDALQGLGQPGRHGAAGRLALAQGGEFGFVLLPRRPAGVIPRDCCNALARGDDPVHAAHRPLAIAASDTIVMRLSRSNDATSSLELHRIAVQSIEAERT